jgi:hypothetical protein
MRRLSNMIAQVAASRTARAGEVHASRRKRGIMNFVNFAPAFVIRRDPSPPASVAAP